MTRNPDVILRHIPPSFFMIDSTKSYNNKVEHVMEVNEFGAFIWNAIEPGDTADTLLTRVLAAITDEKTDDLIQNIREDLDAFLEILLQSGNIVEV